MNLVSDSLPGHFPADDTLFGVIVSFLTPESLTFFNNSSPGDFGLFCDRSLRPTQHVAELGNLFYIHVYEWEGGQKVKQAHASCFSTKWLCKIPSANVAASDIRPGFKSKHQKNRHFPFTILTAIINVLCVACRILPGSNAPFSLKFSYSGVVRCSYSKEQPPATASLGLNTSDTEVLQLDPAKNLDQSQSPLPSTVVVNANY